MSDTSHDSHDINPLSPTTNPADFNEQNQAEDAQSQSTDIDYNSITSHVLQKIDEVLPEDRENDIVQFIKHDMLEAPTAIIGARKDILDMRNRGQRSLFENKGKGKDDNPLPKDKKGRNSRKKDRFSRRMLDTGYMATQKVYRQRYRTRGKILTSPNTRATIPCHCKTERGLYLPTKAIYRGYKI